MPGSQFHRLKTFPYLVWTLLLAACGGGGGGGGPKTTAPNPKPTAPDPSAIDTGGQKKNDQIDEASSGSGVFAQSTAAYMHLSQRAQLMSLDDELPVEGRLLSVVSSHHHDGPVSLTGAMSRFFATQSLFGGLAGIILRQDKITELWELGVGRHTLGVDAGGVDAGGDAGGDAGPQQDMSRPKGMEFHLYITPPTPHRQDVYENHPTTKAAFTVEALRNLELPWGVADNNLFRLANDGRLFFRKTPDYERPADMANSGTVKGDNVYEILVTGLDKDDVTQVRKIEITVLDLDIEGLSLSQARRGYARTSPDQIESDQAPGDAKIKKLIGNSHWVLPESGPLVLSWSMEGLTAGGRAPKSQQDIDTYRAHIERSHALFEAAANIRFVEVDDSLQHSLKHTGHIRYIFGDKAWGKRGDDGKVYSWVFGTAHYPGRKVEIKMYDPNAVRTYTHELGHAFGLKHPYTTKLWPGDVADTERDWSIMNRERSVESLTPFDIAALQYLYGKPGTNNAGISSRKTEPDPPNPKGLTLIDAFPTGFKIDRDEITLSPDATIATPLVLARITIEDDGFGWARPKLVFASHAGGHAQNLRFEKVGESWLLIGDLSGLVPADGQPTDIRFTIVLEASGSGQPDPPPARSFTLKFESDGARPASLKATMLVREIAQAGRNEEDPLPVARIHAEVASPGNEARQVGLPSLSLLGPDREFFELQGGNLNLRAGTILDPKSNPTLDVTIVSDHGMIPLSLNVLARSRQSYSNEFKISGEPVVGEALSLRTDTHDPAKYVVTSLKWVRVSDGSVVGETESYVPDRPGIYRLEIYYDKGKDLQTGEKLHPRSTIDPLRSSYVETITKTVATHPQNQESPGSRDLGGHEQLMAFVDHHLPGLEDDLLTGADLV